MEVWRRTDEGGGGRAEGESDVARTGDARRSERWRPALVVLLYQSGVRQLGCVDEGTTPIRERGGGGGRTMCWTTKRRPHVVIKSHSASSSGVLGARVVFIPAGSDGAQVKYRPAMPSSSAEE